MKTADIIIIGGGLVGAATALGLVQEKAGRVLLLDEQFHTQRASRANFGLTWFMSQEASSLHYVKWRRMAVGMWPEYAAELQAEAGLDLELAWKGGAIHCIGEEQWQRTAKRVETIRQSCESMGLDYPVSMLDRQEFAAFIPQIALGEQVSGAMYSEDQGHVNPLNVLAALRRAFQKRGGIFLPRHAVSGLTPSKQHVQVRTSQGIIECGILVMAAGLGIPRLIEPLGMRPCIQPQRSQILITEHCEPVLPIPTRTVRQTGNGAFMIGLSAENVGHDTAVTLEVLRAQAQEAVALFPALAHINWVRAWSALSVSTPDGGPIYDRIPGHDNIVLLAMHNALSLAPLNTRLVAPWILGAPKPDPLRHFTNGRFHV